MKNRKTQIALIIVSILVIFGAYFRTSGFPFVPFTDAICFLPQSVSYAQGEGLRNIYCFTYIPDGAFIWHGFLFSLLIGLFKVDTYDKVSILLALMNAANVAILAFALARLTCAWKSRTRLFFLSSGLIVQAGYLQGLLGRPESLSSLLVSMGVLMWTFKPNLWFSCFMGSVIGLLAVTSPVTAVSAGICFIIGSMIRFRNLPGFLLNGLLAAVGAVLSILVALYFYPYTWAQWLWGLRIHSGSVIRDSLPTLPVIIRQYFINSGQFMMGLVFLSTLMCGALIILRVNQTNRKTLVFLLSFLGLFGLFVLYYSHSSGYYTMLCLLPLGLAVAALALRPELAGFGRIPKILKISFFLSLSAASLDPILLQIGYFMGHGGLPMNQARRFFAEDERWMTGEVTVSMDLALLTDNIERVHVIYDYVPPCHEPLTQWLVIQQYCFFYEEPPTYEKYYLVKNRFCNVKKWPGRLSQWFGANGYGYAIYKKKT